MGFRSTYKCPVCNYEALTSAGPDNGRNFSSNTFVCKECKVILDRTVSESTGTTEPFFLDGFDEWVMEIMAEGNGIKSESTEKNIQKTEQGKNPRRKKKPGENICPTCEAVELEVWDSKNRPCPKCGTKLIPDPGGPSGL